MMVFLAQLTESGGVHALPLSLYLSPPLELPHPLPATIYHGAPLPFLLLH